MKDARFRTVYALILTVGAMREAAAAPRAIAQSKPPEPLQAPNGTPAPAQPQEDLTPPWDKDFGDRTLKGHTFLFPPHQDSAFIATYVGVRGEVRLLNVPDVVTRFGRLSLNVTGAVESLDFGIKLADVVGLRLSGAGAALVGTNIPSIVYNGATYAFAAGLQVPVRMFRIESSGSQLALVPHFSYATGQLTTLFPLFQARPTVTLDTILQGNAGELIATPIKTTQFGLNAAFAQVISRNFDIQAEAGLGRTVANLDRFNGVTGQRESESTGDWQFDFGVAFTADAGPSGFPLAGLAQWAVVRQPATASLVASPTGVTAHTIAVGAYYSGRRNLQLGVIGALELGLPPIVTDGGTSDRPHSKNARLDLRYVW